ncbi:MAG: DUF2167 domain-containing protein [Rhodobacter sp.]|nr:DUF2167 domain-containing protein [Rhodobacter sp.]
MDKLRRLVFENFVFLLVALLPYAGVPAIVHAQGGDFNPLVFTEPLSLSRGEISPQFQDSYYFKREDYCRIVKEDWGWTDCSTIEAFIVGSTRETDTLIVEPPNSDGYVKFDDWNPESLDAEVEVIEESLKAALKDQGERLNMDVRFVKWSVYPTLNKDKKVMYYATDISFGGDVSTNVKASVFDRRGYVTFVMVPMEVGLSPAAIERIVLDNLAIYTPRSDERYTAFTSGDKIAAAGAVGVLATLVGVKYGKAAATGLLVVILAFLKKGAFLLIVPVFWLFGWIKRMFGGNNNA